MLWLRKMMILLLALWWSAFVGSEETTQMRLWITKGISQLLLWFFFFFGDCSWIKLNQICGPCWCGTGGAIEASTSKRGSSIQACCHRGRLRQCKVLIFFPCLLFSSWNKNRAVIRVATQFFCVAIVVHIVTLHRSDTPELPIASLQTSSPASATSAYQFTQQQQQQVHMQQQVKTSSYNTHLVRSITFQYWSLCKLCLSYAWAHSHIANTWIWSVTFEKHLVWR